MPLYINKAGRLSAKFNFDAWNFQKARGRITYTGVDIEPLFKSVWQCHKPNIEYC